MSDQDKARVIAKDEKESNKTPFFDFHLINIKANKKFIHNNATAFLPYLSMTQNFI